MICIHLIFVSDISEVGRSAQALTELSCRTRPMVSDVSMALIEMGKSSGIDVDTYFHSHYFGNK